MSRKPAIKSPPLRNPGQSLERQREDLLDDGVLFWLMMSMLICAVVIMEWIGWWFDTPRSPWLLTVLAGAVVTLSTVKIRKNLRAVKFITAGLEGERVVGQFLETLRELGYRVFHDVEEHDGDGAKFNIDHVLIGPAGVLALETKTRSKPAAGEAIVTCLEDAVRVDGGPPDTAPIRQARASASRIKQILEESTGHRNIAVRPVVLFPGWYVEGRPNRPTWVLNPRSLPSWLKQEGQVLTPETIALYATRLANHVRDSERRRR